MEPLWLPPLLGASGIVIAALVYWTIQRREVTHEKAGKIAEAIHAGALVFLRQEYLYLTLFVAIVSILIVLGINWLTALAFICGAACSTAAGNAPFLPAPSGIRATERRRRPWVRPPSASFRANTRRAGSGTGR